MKNAIDKRKQLSPAWRMYFAGGLLIVASIWANHTAGDAAGYAGVHLIVGAFINALSKA